jgi:hypothetical protein
VRSEALEQVDTAICKQVLASYKRGAICALAEKGAEIMPLSLSGGGRRFAGRVHRAQGRRLGVGEGFGLAGLVAVFGGGAERLVRVDRPGFLGGCDLWEGWGSWYPERPGTAGHRRHPDARTE